MNIDLARLRRIVGCVIFMLPCLDSSFAKDSERTMLLRWASGEEIITTGSIFELCFKNIAPKEFLSKSLTLDEFLTKFAINPQDKVYNGGANGAMYEVYRLSASRLLVCFTLYTYEKPMKTVRLVTVIPDVSNGSASTSRFNKQIGTDLEKVNDIDMEKFAALVVAELKSRKAVARGAKMPGQ